MLKLLRLVKVFFIDEVQKVYNYKTKRIGDFITINEILDKWYGKYATGIYPFRSIWPENLFEKISRVVHWTVLPFNGWLEKWKSQLQHSKNI